MPGSCARCGVSASRRCSRCQVFYCSSTCQRVHWPIHKEFCRKVELPMASKPGKGQSEALFERCKEVGVNARQLFTKGSESIKEGDYNQAKIKFKECLQDLEPLTTKLQNEIQTQNPEDYHEQNESLMLKVNVWHQLLKLMCKCNFALGEALSQTSDHNSALQKFQEAQQQAMLVKQVEVIDQCEASIAAEHMALGQFAEACRIYRPYIAEMYQKSVHQKGTREMEVATLYNYGISLMRMRQFAQSVEHLSESLHLTKGYFYKPKRSQNKSQEQGRQREQMQEMERNARSVGALSVDDERRDAGVSASTFRPGGVPIAAPRSLALLSLQLSYALVGMREVAAGCKQHFATLQGIHQGEATADVSGAKDVAIAAAAMGGIAQCIVIYALKRGWNREKNSGSVEEGSSSDAAKHARSSAAALDDAAALRLPPESEWGVQTAIEALGSQLRYSREHSDHAGQCHAHRVLAYVQEFIVQPAQVEQARVHRTAMWKALAASHQVQDKSKEQAKSGGIKVSERVLQQDRCCICCEGLRVEEKGVVALPCFHLFHRDCLCNMAGKKVCSRSHEMEMEIIVSMGDEMNNMNGACPICSKVQPASGK